MIASFLIAAMLTQGPMITGQVRDARTHSTIPYAKVELSRGHIPVDQQYTDNDGRFGFEDVSPERYTISVSHAGYVSTAVDLFIQRTPSQIAIDLVESNASPVKGTAIVSARDYLVPKIARKEFDRAKKELSKSDYTKAIEHYESGLKVFDQDASAHNGLGNCYRQMGQFAQAEAEFKRATELDNSVYIALNLADVYRAEKKFPEAEAFLAKVIERSPKDGDAYYGLAVIYYDEKRFEDAKRTALQADSYVHRIPDLHLLLAKIYERKHDTASVIEQLKLYLKEAPDGPESQRVRRALEGNHW